MALIVAGAGALSFIAPRRVDPTGDRATALARALKKRGIETTKGDVQWVAPTGGLLGGAARAVVRGVPQGAEVNDLFLVETTLSPDGVLLAVGDAYDVTETSGADESRPIIGGDRLAYVSRPSLEEAPPTVHVIDLAGQPAPAGDWSGLERLQNAITNAQQAGQLRGLGRRTFAVELPAISPGGAPVGAEGETKGETKGEAKGEAARPAAFARDVRVELDGDDLVIYAQGRAATVPLARPVSQLPAWIRAEASELARPSDLVQWAVDRARAVPWIGDERMQTVKALAFTAKDFIDRNKEHVTGDTGEADIAKDLGKSELDPPVRALPVDPEIGWPPPPLEPWVTPALSSEGQWNPLDKDPFVRRNEGLPPAFVTTFIRADKERKATRVYIALWDPRQVELHMMAGTVEPKGATGEAGPGIIPRTPEVMRRVVAASNAGFQAMHGEFGMMADGVVYLPPKPYAATVAALRDGSTGFGTWPLDPSIPEAVLSYRQNMTVMVQDEKWNPYNRSWWGGTPPGWADKTHTVRTGICLTKEHFIAYFYGADLSPEALAQAMIQARCAFGLALDMNSGHSGLEFYKVAPAEELPSLGRPLSSDWEAEGEVPGLDGYRFRARRLIRGMGLMHFPRYIKREARDYFYMTLRSALPGAPLAPAVASPLPGEGEWRLKGLPQHGFPYAVALTEVRPDAARPAVRVRVLKIDPKTVSAEKSADRTAGKTVAVIDAGEAPRSPAEGTSLWHSAGAFAIGQAAPVPGAVRLASGPGSLAGAGAAVAAIGVHDEEGMLVYVEITGGPATQPASAAGALAATAPLDAKMLEQLLKKLGCSSRLFLAEPLPVALGGDTDLGGSAARAPSGANVVRLARAVAPGAQRIFPDTPVVPFGTWYPLQQQRIRYFKKPPGADAAGGDEAK
jgi:hypothetical protein